MRRHFELTGVRQYTGVCLNVLGKIRKQNLDVPTVCTGYLKINDSGTLKSLYCYNNYNNTNPNVMLSLFRNVSVCSAILWNSVDAAL
jgi:hypothetical protein